MKRNDWEKIKTEYATTDISQRQLAEKYGISEYTIAKYSKDYGWVDARKKYRESVIRKAVQKTACKEANRLSDLMEATAGAIAAATDAIRDPKQFHRFIVTENVGGGATQTEERIYDKLDTKALRDMTAALKDLTGLMRDFYNIPTPAQAEAQRVAAERLETEKRKAEAEDETEKKVVVKLEGLEEYAK